MPPRTSKKTSKKVGKKWKVADGQPSGNYDVYYKSAPPLGGGGLALIAALIAVLYGAYQLVHALINYASHVAAVFNLFLGPAIASTAGFRFPPSCSQGSAAKTVTLAVMPKHQVRVNDELQIHVTVSSAGFDNPDMCTARIEMRDTALRLISAPSVEVPLDNRSRVITFKVLSAETGTRTATLDGRIGGEPFALQEVQVAATPDTVLSLTDPQWKVVQTIGGFVGVPAILGGLWAWLRSRRRRPQSARAFTSYE